MRKPFRAKTAGTCSSCGEKISRGQKITGAPGTWLHAACAENQRNRTLIGEGHTFAARKPSGWRRR